jgi:hypothetical protein
VVYLEVSKVSFLIRSLGAANSHSVAFVVNLEVSLFTLMEDMRSEDSSIAKGIQLILFNVLALMLWAAYAILRNDLWMTTGPQRIQANRRKWVCYNMGSGNICDGWTCVSDFQYFLLVLLC